MKKITISLIFFALSMMIGRSTYAMDIKLIATSSNSYAEQWNRNLGDVAPRFENTKEVMKKQYFTILLFVKGCKTDANMMANVEYDIKITNPDREIYFERTGLVSVSKQVMNTKRILLSEQSLKMCFKTEDPVGKYTIEVKVRDNIAQKSKGKKITIELINYQYQNFFASEYSFEDWLTNYYKSPTPQRAIDGFLYYAKSRLPDKKTSNYKSIAFFVEVFNNNSYLFPYLMELYHHQDLRTKTHILYLLRYCNVDMQSFKMKISETELSLYKRLSTTSLPNPYGKITDTAQVNMLWGIFFASGKYRPIKKLVETLDVDKGDPDMYPLFTATKWSLVTNCAQHQLVNNYCRYIREKELLSSIAKSELTVLLDK